MESCKDVFISDGSCHCPNIGQPTLISYCISGITSTREWYKVYIFSELREFLFCPVFKTTLLYISKDVTVDKTITNDSTGFSFKYFFFERNGF